MRRWIENNGDLFRIAYFTFGALVLLRAFETYLLSSTLTLNFSILPYQFLGLAFDLRLVFFLLLIALLVSVTTTQKTGRIVLISISILVIVSEFSLVVFYSQRGAPLDHELFRRNINELVFVAKTGNIPFFQIAFLLLTIVVFLIALFRVRIKRFSFLLVGMVLSLSTFFVSFKDLQKGYLSQNKFVYFVSKVFGNIVFSETDDMPADELPIEYVNKFYYPAYLGSMDRQFPFLREHDSTSNLYPFFELKSELPNIVVIVVESLCRASSGEGAYMGSFTPFLDSLANHSLYWENCLSSSECTFNVLPSLMGSLPYGAHGLLYNMDFPNHLTLYTYLQELGYETPCYYGADGEYDNTRAFFENQNVSYLWGSILPNEYEKMSIKGGGWTWGYPDEAILDYGVKQEKNFRGKKTLTTYITISTHPPFGFANQDEYTQKATERLMSSNLPEDFKKAYTPNLELLGSFLYLDDCLKNFFGRMSEDESFSNTIFIITGDHHQYSSQKYRLDGYHVPLLIYSPLLKKSQKFKSVVNHGNLTPSIINLLNKGYLSPFATRVNTFVNGDIDTTSEFSSNQNFLMMGCNKEFSYFLKQDTLLTFSKVFKVHAMDSLEEITAKVDRQRFSDIFRTLTQLHSTVVTSNQIIPKEYMTYHDEIDLSYSPTVRNTRMTITHENLYQNLVRIPIGRDYSKVKVHLQGEIFVPSHIRLSEQTGPFVIFSATSMASQSDLKWVSNPIFQSMLPKTRSKFKRFSYIKTIEVPATSDSLIGKLYIHNPKGIDGIKLRKLSCEVSVWQKDER